MDPVEPGLSCGSDTAHMSIFGYDPFQFYRGRGAFETMGSGIDMNVGDIAFKCNFAYMENGIVKLRRVDREFPEWGLPLIDALNTDLNTNIKIEAKHATEHRIGLKVIAND
jgi:2,3-bisphosphoglycerate-independent phosphoglycerate mutase